MCSYFDVLGKYIIFLDIPSMHIDVSEQARAMAKHPFASIWPACLGSGSGSGPSTKRAFDLHEGLVWINKLVRSMDRWIDG